VSCAKTPDVDLPSVTGRSGFAGLGIPGPSLRSGWHRDADARQENHSALV